MLSIRAFSRAAAAPRSSAPSSATTITSAFSISASHRSISSTTYNRSSSRLMSTVQQRNLDGRSGRTSLSQQSQLRLGGKSFGGQESGLRSALSLGLSTGRRGFTIAPARWEAGGQVDAELSAKMDQEIMLEKQSKDPEELPAGLQDFVENSGFEVQDKAGIEEVVLTKTFGDETIKVTFSIADLNEYNQDPDQDSPSDNAMADEDYDDDLTPQSGGASTKGAINQGTTADGNIAVAPEDKVSPADRAEDEPVEDEEVDEEDVAPGFPARVNVTITKPGKGAVQIETLALDSVIEIENVYYFPKADLASAETAETDFKRQEIYSGPPFSNLDEELQILFERYLDERGINSQLAVFVPDYIDWKEQREYVRWLGDVKSFIDA